MNIRLFGREPASIIAVVSAVVTVLVTFNLGWLSPEQGAAFMVVVDALAALATGLMVRPVAPALFVYASSAVFKLLAVYHFHVADETVAAFNVLIVALVVFAVRPQVTPNADPEPLMPEVGKVK